MNKKVLYKLPHMFKDHKGKTRKDSFEKYVVPEDQDFNFSAGIIKKEDLKKEGIINVNKHEVSIFNTSFNDEYSKIKRGAQTIVKKDIGPIITKTGMTRHTKVIDAGAGSGGLSCFLGSIVKKVDTYDVVEKNVELVKKNIEKLKLDNVKVELKDIYESDNFQDEYDVFTLDVPEPWRAWETATKVLKIGGYFVVYSPNIGQIRETILNKPQYFYKEEIIEVIEREWSINEKVSRPVTKDFSHTAFLAFFRKIGKPPEQN